MSALPNRKIAFADTLRGIACCSVVIEHLVMTFALVPRAVSHLTGIDQPTPESAPIAWLHRNCFVNLGGFGVGLFFIISGFVIPMSICRLNRVPFAIARFFRIVPTYAVALLLTMATLWTVCRCFDVSYQIPWQSALAHITFVRDFLWLPSIDGVAWTLEVEMKYYLVCMILAPMIVRSDVRGILLLSAITTAATMWMRNIPADLATSHLQLYAFLKSITTCAAFMNLMWIGTVLSFHWHGKISTRLAAVSVAALCVMFFLQMHTAGMFLLATWRGFAQSYGGVVVLFLLAYAKPHWFSGWRVLTFLAKISYPLYVVHGVIGYAVGQLLIHLGVNLYLTIGCTIALSICLATLVHRFVETPTQEFGRALAKRIQDRLRPKENTSAVETSPDPKFAANREVQPLRVAA